MYASARSRRQFTVFSAIAVAIVLALLGPTLGAAQDSDQQTPIYFDETGQLLSGPFLDAWFKIGGPDRTGFPVSSPVRVGDHWVQWFEYARLEVPGERFETADSDAVFIADLGRSYAERIGYTSIHPAFAPVAGAGEGAEYFEDSGHTLANAFRDTYYQGSNGERMGSPISEEFGFNDSTYQFFERGAMSWTPVTGTVLVPLGTMDAILHGRLNHQIEMPDRADRYTPGLFALRGHFEGERWIEVNTSTYTLTAWVGDTPVMSTLVVTGAPISPTVVGEFRVYWKLESQTMSGVGPDGVAYRQPDVPAVMYFFEDWAIHGAYWRSGFGYAASHGCVNVPLDEADWLWEWASVGTRVVVHA